MIINFWIVTWTLMKAILVYSKSDLKKMWIIKTIDFLNDKEKILRPYWIILILIINIITSISYDYYLKMITYRSRNIYQNPFFTLDLISNGFNINVILPSIDEMVDDNDCLRQSWYPTTKLIIVHSKAVYLDKQNVI